MSEKKLSVTNKMLLSIVVGSSALLSFLFVYLDHLLEEAHNPGVLFNSAKENYLYSVLIFISLTVVTFSLGLIVWLFFRKRRKKILFFLASNVLGLVFLTSINVIELYRIWHYKKYQANIDYNESLTRRTGTYLDSCIMMVQNEILKKGFSLNDFRILNYEYEVALATVPRDTTNRYYSFNIFYFIDDTKKMRAAAYLVNFKGKIKEVYDVDQKNANAKKQIESLRKNIEDLKIILEKHPDPFDKTIDAAK